MNGNFNYFLIIPAILILPKWTAIANYIKRILCVHILGREPNLCPMVEWAMPKKWNASKLVI
jgi:hypothetical protein